MHLLDLLLTFLPLLLVAGVGIYATRYARSVVDFMSGGRCAGRYLIAVATGELHTGAVVFVATFEYISTTGFTLGWWDWIAGPFLFIVGVSGFVIYRYRQTRAMTLAQFFEIRYSKSFRLFTGILGFLAGIFNFGIIPAIGARCLVYFLELPPAVTVFSHAIPTYIPLMAVFLSISLSVALSGGVITVLIINCIEGIMSQAFCLIILVALCFLFSWHQISTVLVSAPPGHSLVNPFDSTGIKDFNIWFKLMIVFVSIYGTMAWQNCGPYNSVAFSPHESRMGLILWRWTDMARLAFITLLGICALTYMHHPDFAAGAAKVRASVHQIANPQAREQMMSPIAISHFLPWGIRGIFCSVLLMGIFGGDSTHLHSWGSIFVQDLVVPRVKRPLSPRAHILALRCSIAGVALFAFLFGALFTQTEYIFMWFYVTQAIFTGGAGSAIIGGLYWKKGTSAGAWAAVIVGSSLSVGGILARQFYGDGFPLNGTQISFFATLVAIATYIIVSLLTHREDFNMDRMLHRGAYAAPGLTGEMPPLKRTNWLGKLIGADEDFTLGDKWISGSLLGWGFFWLVVFLIGTAWNLIAPWPNSVWATFWKYAGVVVPVVLIFVVGGWFTWGGTRDVIDLFRRLRGEKINPLDDGTVVDHQNLDEVSTEKLKEIMRRP